MLRGSTADTHETDPLLESVDEVTKPPALRPLTGEDTVVAPAVAVFLRRRRSGARARRGLTAGPQALAGPL